MADFDHEQWVLVRVPVFGDRTVERDRTLRSVARAVHHMVKHGATVQSCRPEENLYDGGVVMVGPRYGFDAKGDDSGHHGEEHPKALIPIDSSVIVVDRELSAAEVLGLAEEWRGVPDPEFGWTHLCEESPDSPGWCAYHRSYCTADGPGPHVTDHPE